jgi:excisionase family DNA binding protein
MRENVVPHGLARVADAVEFLRVSRSKIYLMMDAGDIAYVKLGKARRIPWSELSRLIERHTVPARDDRAP